MLGRQITPVTWGKAHRTRSGCVYHSNVKMVILESCKMGESKAPWCFIKWVEFQLPKLQTKSTYLFESAVVSLRKRKTPQQCRIVRSFRLDEKRHFRVFVQQPFRHREKRENENEKRKMKEMFRNTKRPCFHILLPVALNCSSPQILEKKRIFIYLFIYLFEK